MIETHPDRLLARLMLPSGVLEGAKYLHMWTASTQRLSTLPCPDAINAEWLGREIETELKEQGASL